MYNNAGAAGMGGGGHMYPPPQPPVMAPPPHAHGHGHGHEHQQQQPPPPRNNWVGNDANTLLVVATLITTLTYQIASNIPGGFWQDTDKGHVAGDPIMRDLHRPRYWVFMAASWMGFAGSMLMTLSLLVRMPVESRHVRWSFAVAYSSLVLTFVVSQPRTHLSLDIIVWVLVVAFLWLMISVRPDNRARIARCLCCAGDN